MVRRNEKSVLEFLQERLFVSRVATAIRGRAGRIGLNSNRSGVPASPLRCATPVGVVVPFGAVVGPVKGLQVREFVPTSLGLWFYVVHLPTEIGRGLSVISPAHKFSANILPDDFGTVTGNDLALVPNRPKGGLVKGSVGCCGIVSHVCLVVFGVIPPCLPRRRAAGQTESRQKLTKLNQLAAVLLASGGELRYFEILSI